MHMPRNGMIAGSTLLLAVAMAGCSDQAITTDPALRAPAGGSSMIITPVVTTWDFAALFGTAGGHDLGTTHTFTNGSNGSIVASSTDRRVTVKGFELATTDPERGLGLCFKTGTNQSTACTLPDDGDEVGDPGTGNNGVGTLLLNFSGVLPAGSVATSVSLGSLQTNEGFSLSISTDGGVTFGTPITGIPNTVSTIFDVSLNGGAGYPTANLVIKFQKLITGTCWMAAVNPCDDDYTVRTVTTSFTPPASTLFCTPGFWKNKGLDLWTNGHGLFYNSYAGQYPSPPQTFAGYDFGKKSGSQNPTLLDVVSQPNIYGGDAANNVAALIGSVLFGSPININQNPENCPDNLTIINNFPPPV
jgi:hypothetical protein